MKEAKRGWRTTYSTEIETVEMYSISRNNSQVLEKRKVERTKAPHPRRAGHVLPVKRHRSICRDAV